MNPREQIINFLLQHTDQQQRTIEGLQKQVVDLQRELATAKGQSATAQPADGRVPLPDLPT